MTEDLPVGLLGILSLSVFSMVPNRVIGEIVLDGGGRFSPAGIFGLHTLSLLLSSRATHDRAAEVTREHTIQHTRENTNTWAQYIRLDREVLSPSPCE